jgi:hypothetical protein
MKIIKLKRGVDYVRTSHNITVEPIKGLKLEIEAFGSLNQGSSEGLERVFIHEIDDYDIFKASFLNEEVNISELKSYFSTKENLGLFKKTWKLFTDEVEEYIDTVIRKSIDKDASNIPRASLKELVFNVAIPYLEKSGCLIDTADGELYYSNKTVNNKVHDLWTCRELVQIYTGHKAKRILIDGKNKYVTPCNEIYKYRKLP